MKYFANQMGLKEDQVTLSRPLVSPQVNQRLDAGADEFKTEKIEFTAPLKTIDKDTRVFIIE